MPTSRYVLRAVGILWAALLLGAAGPEPAATDIVAQAGGTTLTLTDVRAMLTHLEPAIRERLLSNSTTMAEFVRARMVQLELLNQARSKHWDQDPDVAYRAEMAREAVIADSYLASLAKPDPNYPSDSEIATAYEANKTKFVIPRQYHLAQVFVAVPQNAPKQQDDEAQKRLRELKQGLARSHGDFADAARHFSQDNASAGNGGDLGWLREDQLVAGIRQVVEGLPEKAVSDPIHLPDGWHLVKVLGTRPASTAPLADMNEQLVRALRQQKAAENSRAYLAQMQKQDPIALNEITLARIVAH